MSISSRFAVVATLLSLLMLSLAVVPATASPTWYCVTDRLFPSSYAPHINVSGSARVIESRWWYPVFTSRGVTCNFKTYYILWGWDSRDAKIVAYLNATGNLKGLPKSFVRKSEVWFYLGMQSDRGRLRTAFALRMKPEIAKQMEELGLMDFIKNITAGMLISGYPLAVALGVEGMMYEVAVTLGTTLFYRKMFLPIYVEDQVSRSKGVWKDKYEFGFLESMMMGNWYTYEPVFSFRYEDDAGCDGCILWWCWGCQSVSQPSANAGIAVLADPEGLPSYTIAIARVLTIIREEGRERAFFSVIIGVPKGYNITITVPPGAEVIDMSFGDYNVTMIRREVTGGKYPVLSVPKPSNVGVGVSGINEGYFPEPGELQKSLFLTQVFGRESYESFDVRVADGVAYSTLVVVIGKSPATQPQTLLGVLPLTIVATAIALVVTVPIALKHTLWVARERRKRFVRRKSM